jgi:hypothetical protein
MRALQLVLAPALAFADLERRLDALGWRRQPGELAAPPLIGGEPELASFRSADDATLLTYTYNPVVGLRVLSLQGEAPGEAARRIAAEFPTLGADEIDRLLDQRDPRRALLGAMAARTLEMRAAAPRIARLAAHAEPAVARTARAILRELTADIALEALGAVFERVGADVAKAHAAYPTGADVATRRQIVRRRGRAGEQGAEAVLRQALADPDLEVRASTVLLTARAGVVALRTEVARADLTSADAPLASRDRRLLEAMRRAALASLDGQRSPPAPPPEDTSEATERDHVWRCVLGLPVTAEDELFLTAGALTTPLDLPPAPLHGPLGPPADGGFRLAPLATRFRWIAATPHWLGHEEPTEISNPIRRWTPPGGALIAERPLTCRDVAALGLPVSGPADAPAALTAAEASRALARLAGAAATTVTRPPADLVEAGLRGPDGRRHPWGFCPTPAGPFEASPWGLVWAADRRGEWTSDQTMDERPVIAASDRRGRPSLRIAGTGTPEERRLLRPTIAVG